jgi:hypothetical protein
MPPAHLAFADETRYNIGRFRGVALVTLPAAAAPALEAELAALLCSAGLAEFKWEKLRTARSRFAALALIDLAVARAAAGVLRVDVVVWDIADTRHAVHARDDVANLQRMYCFLFSNVLRLRWPAGSQWRLHPDQQTALAWDQVADYLDAAADQVTAPSLDLFGTGGFQQRLRREFAIAQVAPLASHASPLIQLADLFAGMAVFSRASFADYDRWQAEFGPQPRLLPAEAGAPLSNSARERCRVLHHLDERCKAHKLGVSLKTRRGLWTRQPHNPINFWWYTPQHPGDVAPRKPR